VTFHAFETCHNGKIPSATETLEKTVQVIFKQKIALKIILKVL